MRHFIHRVHVPRAALIAAVLFAACARAGNPESDPRITGSVSRLAATHVEQLGTLPEGVAPADALVLSNEPDAPSAGIALEFDLAALADRVVPLARLRLADVAKVPVKRPGARQSGERGAVHVSLPATADGPAALIASMPVKPGHATTYVLDVTDAVNAMLGRLDGARTLRLEVRITGKPLPYEVYGLPVAVGHTQPTLEVVSEPAWNDDWEERIAPLTTATIYREACLPLVEDRAAEAVVQLLYPARRIIEVVCNLTGEKLEAGRDYDLRDGLLVLRAGNPAIQFAPEFFAVERKGRDGAVTASRNAIQLMEGTWYQERQLEVTYEPVSRDWNIPAASSSLADLPRTRRLLEAKEPLRLILFGDSISAGGNASKFQGARPWQPTYGELVVRALRRQYGGPIEFMNHSRGGATSSYAATQADSQVAWFKPDLVIVAYGMNDRSEERRPGYRANLEKILATVRARSPETEFVVVTPMLNNPKQPSGLDPVLFIRDEALQLGGPGVALVDITTTHLRLLDCKEYLDTSGNGANHPNDFLHRIYAQRILEVLVP
jgi:acyl-CoA thioesterase I